MNIFIKPATAHMASLLRRTLYRSSFMASVRLHNILFAFALLFTAVLTSCENSREEFVTENWQEYYPLQPGKSITYRLDSVVFVQSGSRMETHKYQVKHTVQSEITDAQGRKAFLIHRLIRNEAGTSPWLENGSYTVTPLADKAEVVEQNMRVIKLHNPVKKNFSWRGNAYLPGSPYRPAYNMDAGSDMNEWQFMYTNFGDTAVNGQSYQNVWTVSQNHYILNFPITPNTSIAVMEVAEEKYAKNVGLVYKNFQLYEYQRPNVDNPQATYTGFGITMWMIGHD